MKKAIFIILILFTLLSISAQDSYNTGKRIVHLTLDSTVVVMFTPKKQPFVAALPRHFKLKESIPYTNSISLDLYDVTALGKEKYNLTDSKLFPKELPIMPCFLDENGEQLIPTGSISVMLKNRNDTCALYEIAEKVGVTVGERFMEYCYKLPIIPSERFNVINIAKKLYETGLFEIVNIQFYNPIILETSYDARVHE